MISAKTRASAQYAKLVAETEKTKRADQKVVREKEEAQRERATKGARLKALRLAKEAGDEQAVEAAEAKIQEETAGDGPKRGRRSHVHRRRS